jgi:hypothetical protein
VLVLVLGDRGGEEVSRDDADDERAAGSGSERGSSLGVERNEACRSNGIGRIGGRGAGAARMPAPAPTPVVEGGASASTRGGRSGGTDGG